MSASRAALIRRQLRQRFGITANRVAVRTALPWYWRTILFAVVTGIALAAALWIFEAGIKLAGHDRSEARRQLGELRSQVEALARDKEELTRAARAAEGRIQVEVATQETLVSQIRSLQQENAMLREDVGLFEGFVSGASVQSSGPRIVRVALESIGDGGRFKYRMLLFHRSSQRGGAEFRGELQFDLQLERDGKDANMRIPDPSVADDRYRVVVRHFHRVEGEFQLPPGSVIKGGEARLLQGGVVHARHSIVL